MHAYASSSRATTATNYIYTFWGIFKHDWYRTNRQQRSKQVRSVIAVWWWGALHRSFWQSQVFHSKQSLCQSSIANLENTLIWQADPGGHHRQALEHRRLHLASCISYALLHYNPVSCSLCFSWKNAMLSMPTFYARCTCWDTWHCDKRLGISYETSILSITYQQRIKITSTIWIDNWLILSPTRFVIGTTENWFFSSKCLLHVLEGRQQNSVKPGWKTEVPKARTYYQLADLVKCLE